MSSKTPSIPSNLQGENEYPGCLIIPDDALRNGEFTVRDAAPPPHRHTPPDDAVPTNADLQRRREQDLSLGARRRPIVGGDNALPESKVVQYRALEGGFQEVPRCAVETC